MIPDVPTLLKEQIRREAYVTSEIILHTELQRAQGIDVGGAALDDKNSIESERYSPRHSEDFDTDVRQRQKDKSHVKDTFI